MVQIWFKYSDEFSTLIGNKLFRVYDSAYCS